MEEGVVIPTEITEETTPSNLPSDIQDTSIDGTKWEVNDTLKERFKEGKLLDRFASLDELVDGYQDMQKKHTNYVREVKEGQKSEDATIESIQAERQAEQVKSETMSVLVNEMISNDMAVTEDMQAKLEEAGLDVRDLKLNAIDSKEAVNKAYESVGGREEYEAMATWAKENLSDEVRLEFDKNLKGASADIYIQGLHARYKANVGNTETSEPSERISGEPAVVGASRGYTTKAEMLRDATYINGKGATDTAAKNAYRARLSRTSDEVIYR